VLSARPQLAAADYARLATDTVGFAAQPTAPRGPARAGVIDDALAAVGRGERLDAGAADWTSLREQLEALRDPPEPPQQDQPQDGDSRREQPADQNAASAGAGQENRDPAQSGTQAQPGDADAGDPTSGGEDAPDAQAPAAEAAPDAQAKDPSAGAAEPSADGQPPERPDSSARAEAGQAGDTPPTEAARPLDAAGLEDADRARPEAPAPDQPADGEAASEPATATRSVGGGQVRTGREAAGDPAGGGLEARARQVEQGDAPAVLFERMARAEGRPRAAANAKNW
jgi:hypothetical protein